MRRTAIQRLGDAERLRRLTDESPLHRIDRHGGPGTQRRSHLQQHRQHAHHRLQAAARRVPGPALPVLPPRRRIDLGPGHHGPGRHRDRLGRASTAATPRVMSQGTVSPTEKELDVAIRGEGFFVVQLPDGRTGYTRDGSFERSADRRARQRRRLRRSQPGITIPGQRQLPSRSAPTAPSRPSSTTTPTPTQIGQLQLARFVNKAGLESAGDNLFLETASSGPAQVGTPNDDGMGNLLQGYLEMLQRQLRHRNRRPDRRPARLRDERPRHLRRRRDDAGDEPAALTGRTDR